MVLTGLMYSETNGFLVYQRHGFVVKVSSLWLLAQSYCVRISVCYHAVKGPSPNAPELPSLQNVSGINFCHSSGGGGMS